jgi:cytoskeletal protein CcmA (bactofilin family)
MFNKDKRKKNAARLDTLIGQHTQIKGDVTFSGGLRIDGSVTGNIFADKDSDAVLTLSDQGHIEGDVKVPNLLINGTISGNVYAVQHVELAAKAKIKGNVYYHMLEMAMGAEVNGQLIRMTEEKSDAILDLEHENVEGSDEDKLRLPPE